VPTISKHPVEYFGYSFTNFSNKAQKARNKQYCPFLDDNCKKPRKSEPRIKVGVCTVGYRGNWLSQHEPIIICPFRFYQREVYDKIVEKYFGELSDEYEIEWVPEVSMGVGGSIDFVIVKLRKEGGLKTIEDFVCVEFQAAGTTGTPWGAVLEFKKHKKFLEETYKFGINWANEFAKTMMQQVYKKGNIVESWGKKIIFVFQDVGLGYLENSYDVSGLRDTSERDSILFYVFKMVWDDKSNGWKLKFNREMSTNTEGVRRILSGAKSGAYPTIERFKENIKRKMANASIAV
jgi:hypothetical protein